MQCHGSGNLLIFAELKPFVKERKKERQTRIQVSICKDKTDTSSIHVRTILTPVQPNSYKDEIDTRPVQFKMVSTSLGTPIIHSTLAISAQRFPQCYSPTTARSLHSFSQFWMASIGCVLHSSLVFGFLQFAVCRSPV